MATHCSWLGDSYSLIREPSHPPRARTMAPPPLTDLIEDVMAKIFLRLPPQSCSTPSAPPSYASRGSTASAARASSAATAPSTKPLPSSASSPSATAGWPSESPSPASSPPHQCPPSCSPRAPTAASRAFRTAATAASSSSWSTVRLRLGILGRASAGISSSGTRHGRMLCYQDRPCRLRRSLPVP